MFLEFAQYDSVQIAKKSINVKYLGIFLKVMEIEKLCLKDNAIQKTFVLNLF